MMQEKWQSQERGEGREVGWVPPGCPKEPCLVNEGSPAMVCGRPGAFETEHNFAIFLSTPVRTVMTETRGAVNTGI